jgi:4-hydroxythreonine-4-phosphate dehydrogenase
MSSAGKPLLVTLGDPCGIGPEIVASAWRALKADPGLSFAVLGDARRLKAHVPLATIGAAHEAASVFSDALPVLDRPLTVDVVSGRPDARHAPHIIAWIEEAVALCRSGQARGLITAPIAKAVLYEAGFRFPGHTEYLAELCRDGQAQPPHPVMMLTAPDDANKSALRVVLATIHVAIEDVSEHLNPAIIIETARITHEALKRDFGLAKPRIAFAALNPHAGEDGSIGREEIDILRPAAHHLRNESIDISDPLPADTLFHAEARRAYDAVLCMYHDQGLIPLKTLDFWRGVNITLGLPIVRTSPDHGTGFDIAGKGVARADSLIEAIRAANAIATQRERAA